MTFAMRQMHLYVHAPPFLLIQSSIPSLLTPYSTHLYIPSHLISNLILPSRSLTSLQLIKIPPTNRQIALILIHTLAEIIHIRRADLRGLVILVHGVGAVVLLGDGLVDGCGFDLLGRAAAEEAADCVADGGSDCDAAI
jgi:hypothetical protein